MKIHAFRLIRGMDLKKEINDYVISHNIKAGCILSAVGSLSQVTLRAAGAKETKTFVGEYEITSITGTLSLDGSHLHLTCSDNAYKTLGGHLKISSIVDTTVEVVIAEFLTYSFKRKFDDKTGYKELVVSENIIQKL